MSIVLKHYLKYDHLNYVYKTLYDYACKRSVVTPISITFYTSICVESSDQRFIQHSDYVVSLINKYVSIFDELKWTFHMYSFASTYLFFAKKA